MQSPYLVQRSKFKDDVAENTGIDSILRMDYMGSAEFEFGSLPKSLKEMCDKITQLKMNMVKDVVNYKEQCLFLICFDDQIEDITKFFKAESGRNSTYHLKEYSGINEAIHKTDCLGKHVKDDWNICQHWWDIINHWMACFGKENAEKVMTALQKVKVKKDTKAWICEDQVQEILKLKYPNKWVVVVRAMDWDIVNKNHSHLVMEYLRDTYTKLGIYQGGMTPSPIHDGVFIECETEEDAEKVFSMFPEEKAPYTILWGPIHEYMTEITKDMDIQKREQVAAYNQHILKLRIENPLGMIHSENT